MADNFNAEYKSTLKLVDSFTGPMKQVNQAMIQTINSMRQLDGISKNQQQALDVAAKNAKQAETAINQLSSTTSKYASDADKASSSTSMLGRVMDGVSGSASGLVAGVLGAIGAYHALSGAVSAVKSSLNQGWNFHIMMQEANASLEVFLGSAEKAETYMSNLYALALETPFAFPDLLASGKQLIAFNIEADNTFRIIRAIGDATSAVGAGTEGMKQLTDIFTSIQAAGKLSLDEVNRLTSFGINALDVFAKKAGVSADEMKKQISKGAVGSAEAITVLVEEIERKFGGLMAGVKDTITGSIDSMKSAFRNAGVAMVEPFVEPLTKGIQTITEQLKLLPQYVMPAVLALVPLVDAFNDLFDDGRAEAFFRAMGVGLFMIAKTLSIIGQLVMGSIGLMFDLFTGMEPVIYAVGGALAVLLGVLILYKLGVFLVTMATRAWAGAQMLVNAAFKAHPIVRVILIVVAVIALVIYATVKWADVTGKVVGFIFGIVFALVAFLINIVIAIINVFIMAATIFVMIWHFAVFAVKLFFIGLVFLILLVMDVIINIVIAVAMAFAFIWHLAVFLVKIAFITLVIVVANILIAIANFAIMVAQTFILIWHFAIFAVKMFFWGLSVLVLTVLDVIVNVALAAAEIFADIWNTAVYGVQLAFYKMADMVLGAMETVASGTIGVVNQALNAISNLINFAVKGLNKVIEAANKIPGVNVGSIGEVGLEVGAGVTSTIQSLRGALEAPVKPDKVELPRSDLAGKFTDAVPMPEMGEVPQLGGLDFLSLGDALSGIEMGSTDFGGWSNMAGGFMDGVSMPEMGSSDPFGGIGYIDLGAAFDSGMMTGVDGVNAMSDGLKDLWGMIDSFWDTDMDSLLEAGKEPEWVDLVDDADIGDGEGGGGGKGGKGGGKKPSGGKGGKGGGGKGGKGGKNPTGGKLDSIGKIDDDINIADEDLKMLLDIADRKNIQNFVTLTPTVEISDVTLRENADIDDLYKKITDNLVGDIEKSAKGVYGL